MAGNFKLVFRLISLFEISKLAYSHSGITNHKSGSGHWFECQKIGMVSGSDGLCTKFPSAAAAPFPFWWANGPQRLRNPNEPVKSEVSDTVLPSGIKIVNGYPASPGQFPYQISLFHIYDGDDRYFNCGGSIYNEYYIITAAHCVDAYGDYSIVAGDHNINEVDEEEQVIEVEEVIIHGSYNWITMENDIALLKLKTPLRFTDYVKSINLPLEGQTADGIAIVSGWGTTSEGGYLADILRYTDVDIIPDETCAEAYDNLVSSMICAAKDGHDSCQGDSGGPMACYDGEQEGYLCGIVSFGNGCGRPNYPGVYTKVSHYVSWIHEMAK